MTHTVKVNTVRLRRAGERERRKIRKAIRKRKEGRKKKDEKG